MDIKDVQIEKDRGYKACIAEANNLLLNNIKTIFKRTWISTAVCAVATSILMSCLFSELYDGSNISSVFTTAASLLMVCAQVAYMAQVYGLINGQKMKRNVQRYAILAACYIVISFVLSMGFSTSLYLYTRTHFVTVETLGIFSGIYFAFTLALMAILLPYAYATTKYMLDNGCSLGTMLTKSYRIGLRHWGFIFITLLLTMLCAYLCCIVVSAPMLIVLVANTFSFLGATNIGDPTGLPEYFPVLRFVVVALFSFVCLYINMFVVFVCCFMYGSIKAKEKGRKASATEQ